MNSIKLSLLLIFIFFGTLEISCDSKSEGLGLQREELIKTGSDFITIQFENPSNIDSLIFQDKETYSWKNRIAYLYNGKNITFIDQKRNIIFPTIREVALNENIILSHKLNYIDYIDYVFKSNDSVLITYFDKRPIVKILNREVKKHDYDIEFLVRDIFNAETILPLSQFFRVRYIWTKKEFNNKVNKDYKSLYEKELYAKEQDLKLMKEFYISSKKVINIENKYLDSLFNNNFLSLNIYDFYKSKIHYLNFIIDTKTNNSSLTEAKLFLNENAVKPVNYEDVYRHQALDEVLFTYFIPKLEYIDQKDGINRDYKKLFDLIENSDIFNNRDQEYLLYKQINRIGNTDSNSDFMSYYNKFKSIVKDTSLLNSVRNTFALEFDSARTEASTVVLKDSKGRQFSFNEILEVNKGKVVYVDFWASWCGPCRKVMPISTTLRQDLIDNDVVFIYLSIDNNFEDWQKANIKEGLNNYKNSYIIVNHQTSEFLKQSKLTTIPRYMIFDKGGQLAYANAPRVESNEIGLLLKKMASKP